MGGVIKIELIRKAGAAAAFDANPKVGLIGLFRQNRFNARGS